LRRHRSELLSKREITRLGRFDIAGCNRVLQSQLVRERKRESCLNVFRSARSGSKESTLVIERCGNRWIRNRPRSDASSLELIRLLARNRKLRVVRERHGDRF
jgi:hypothetical protein